MRRVAVFADWMNCYHAAREAFHGEGDPGRYGELRPAAFAQMLVEKGDHGVVTYNVRSEVGPWEK